MRFRLLTVVVALCIAGSALAQDSEPARVPVRELSYQSLDSMIRSKDLTAVYLWAGWCSFCRMNISRFSELMRRFPQLSFLSVNDPDSRGYLPGPIVDSISGAAGIFQIERNGRQKMVALNDRSQFNYFNRRYVGAEPKSKFIQYLYLLDRSGKVLYSYKYYELDVDSITKALTVVLKSRNAN